MFKHHGYISVSGFGSDRPAYRTTPAVIRDTLSQSVYPELATKLKNLDLGQKVEPFTDSELSVLAPELGKSKTKLTDRIDIILVYRGLSTENNFVYPSVPSDSPTPPEWVNDVSWPQTDQRFLRLPSEDSAP